MEMVKSTFKLTQRTFPLAKRSVSSISNNEKEKENCKHKNLMIFSFSIYHRMHKNQLHLRLFMELMPKNAISKYFICVYVQDQKFKMYNRKFVENCQLLRFLVNDFRSVTRINCSERKVPDNRSFFKKFKCLDSNSWKIQDWLHSQMDCSTPEQSKWFWNWWSAWSLYH